MKKITFGVPEEYVPSKFCKGFYYEQGKVAYPVEKIAFNINDRGCQLELPMDRDEQFYGLGLQLQQFNLRGRHAKLTVNSDPIAPTGDSHAPVPFFVSTKGYGIYFDTARYVEFDFARVKKQDLITKQAHTQVGVSTDEIYALKTTDSKEVISVQIPCAKGIEIYIIEGKNITEVVSQYNMLSGGGADIPDWGLGLFYRCFGRYTRQQVLSVADYFDEKKIPCSVIGLEPGWQTRSYSCSFIWNSELYPDPQSMIEELYARGYHVNLWEHAFTHPVSPMYEGLYPHSADYTVWEGLVPDFTNKDARDVFANYHERSVSFGIIDGYKLDECDSSDYAGGWSFPLNTKMPYGMDGEQYHSMMGTLYAQTIMQSLNGKLTYSEVRNLGALASSYPFALYSDLYKHEDFIRGVVNAGFSGLLWAPEVRHADSKEEFLRRLQVVVFSAQCLVNAWYCEEMPWLKFNCEEEVKSLILLREQLKPMLKESFELYKKMGKPPIRALVSDYTQDTETHNIDNEYLFCEKLLVAPIPAGQSKRQVYLPKGKWKNYFTGEEVNSGWFEVESEQIPVYEMID